MHVALRRNGRKVIELLFHAEHGQCRHAQNLGFTALEESRTVNARQNLDLCAQGADGAQRTTVHANFFAQSAVTDGLLLEGAESCLEFLLSFGPLFCQSIKHLCLDGVHSFFASKLALGEECLGELVANPLLNSGVLLIRVVEEDREFGGFLRGDSSNLHLGFAQRANEGLGSFEAVSDHIFGRSNGACLNQVPFVFAAASFDHHDRNVFAAIFSGDDATCDNDIEDRAFHLRPARECHPLAIDESQTGTGNGAGEGQTSNLGRHGGRVDRQHVIGVVRVCSQDGCDNLNLVAQALLESGAQRAVDQTSRKNCLGSGTAFTAEEGSGDTTRGVGTFLNVDGQREKVELVLGLLARGGCGKNRSFIIKIGHGRTCGLLGEAASFKADNALTETTIVDDRLCRDDIFAFHHMCVLLEFTCFTLLGRSYRPSIEVHGFDPALPISLWAPEKP